MNNDGFTKTENRLLDILMDFRYAIMNNDGFEMGEKRWFSGGFITKSNIHTH
jgi:hypothetical protein